MSEKFCSNCGAALEEGATVCNTCGAKVEAAQTEQTANDAVQTPAAPAAQNGVQQSNEVIDSSWPVKSKIAAGILAILLGDFGIHKFYMGKIGLGILYLVFCWTGIPGIIGLIEGILYLCASDESFEMKNHVRIG